MKKSITIAIACAIGAGLGTLLALSFGALWIFGLLIGAIGGYLIYDFPAVIAAVPTAFMLAFDTVNKIDQKKVKEVIVENLKVAFVILVLLIPLVFYASFISIIAEDASLVAILFWFVLPTSILYWQSYMNLFVAEFWDVNTMRLRKFMPQLKTVKLTKVVFWAKRNRLNGLFVILFSTVIASVVFTIWLFEKIFVIFPKFVLRQIHFTGRFLWELFKLIHSDIRLLVGIDSFIGACVGFYIGNILIGMVVGAIFGFFNYRFVSIKWLKLQPKH